MSHRHDRKCLLCRAPNPAISLEGEPFYFDNAMSILATFIGVPQGVFPREHVIWDVTPSYFERKRFNA